MYEPSNGIMGSMIFHMELASGVCLSVKFICSYVIGMGWVSNISLLLFCSLGETKLYE